MNEHVKMSNADKFHNDKFQTCEMEDIWKT